MKYLVIYSFSIAFFVCLTQSILAQGPVHGEQFGTWETGTYIFTDTVTVPNGKTLTIKPGTNVIIAENLSLNVEGTLIAIGTEDQPITFAPPNDSTYWKRIFVKFNSGNETTKFQFCDFRNAKSAIVLRIVGINDTMRTVVENCTFSNCLISGIYGESKGLISAFPQTPLEPHLNPTITNCIFDSCYDGIKLKIIGICRLIWPRYIYGRGHASPFVYNNLFKDLNNAAINMLVGNWPGASIPIFKNNTVANCNGGVLTTDPYDCTIENNIFYKAAPGVERSGEFNLSVSHNLFFDNDSSDFVGYPSSYGDVIWQNSNGDPSDLSFNIFLNPLFADSSFYEVTGSSPALGAGASDSAGLPTNIGAFMERVITSVEAFDNNSNLPGRFQLRQNYPNPFNPTTTIEFSVKTSGFVSLVVYNSLGQKVTILVNENRKQGYYFANFDASGLASGIYFYELRSPDGIATKRMILKK